MKKIKLFLNITEDWKEIDYAIEFAEQYLKDFIEPISEAPLDLDLNQDYLYETTTSWNWLKRTKTKSLSNRIISILGRGMAQKQFPRTRYDYHGIIVDKNKSLEENNLYGQHSSQYKTIEIYAYKGRKNKKMWGLPYTTYNLVHELLHAITSHYGLEDNLHQFLKDNPKTRETLDRYVESLREQVKPAPIHKGEQPLVKRLAEKMIEHAKIVGLNLRVTSFYRSHEEQDELYAQGRTTSGRIVTNAKGGESLHNYGVAFDIVDRYKGYNLTDEEWKILAFIWKWITLEETGYYGEWGGDWANFKDRPHFSLMLDYKLSDFQNNKVDYRRFK